MPRLRVNSFSISLDGYGAGPNQSIDNAFGEGGLRLTEWMESTRTFQRLVGDESAGETGIDDDFAAHSFEGIGATIMGRNMFGPMRGAWADDSWKGWWGPNPPYHHPVFILTHHPRDPITMEGGTTFHFVTDGIEAALEKAFEAAAGLDVIVRGGPGTIQSYLRAGLVDELHVVVSPLLLGAGERLFDEIGGAARRYQCTQLVSTKRVTHVVLERDPEK
jgi:dihydrofolate reductase